MLGLFIQITAPDEADFPVPGAPYSFSVLKDAQALGDFQSLVAHGRRAIRVDVGKDVLNGLQRLQELIEQALLGRPEAGASHAFLTFELIRLETLIMIESRSILFEVTQGKSALGCGRRACPRSLAFLIAMTNAAIGLIGLGVMGQNLALNIERNGFPIAVYDREPPVLDAFISRHPGKANTWRAFARRVC